MSTQTFYIISFLGAIQGSLVSAILWFKKANTANKFFTFFLLLYSIGLLEPYLTSLLQPGNPVLDFLSFSNFLYGPLIYLYVVHLHKTLSANQTFVHFLPFISGFTLISLIRIFSITLPANGMVDLILFEILIIQLLGYTVAALGRLRANGSLILRKQKIFTLADAKWLQYFLVSLLCIYCISFTISHLSMFGFTRLHILHRVNQVFMMLSIYAVAYKLLLKPEFLIPKHEKNQLMQNGAARYTRSGLTEEKAFEHLQALQQYMLAGKPFLNPDLSVHELANQLGISKNHLTQILNEKLGKNFYGFVNDYRVEEAKHLISCGDLEHLNLSAIGLQSGFKSKTGFNTNFKKATGLTPSEWKRNCS